MIRQVMGLPDEIHGVPIAERYPGTHAQAIDPGAGGLCPSRDGRSESSTLPGATCTLSSVCEGVYHPSRCDFPYEMVSCIRHIDTAIIAGSRHGYAEGIVKLRRCAGAFRLARCTSSAGKGAYHPRHNGDFPYVAVI